MMGYKIPNANPRHEITLTKAEIVRRLNLLSKAKRKAKTDAEERELDKEAKPLLERLTYIIDFME